MSDSANAKGPRDAEMEPCHEFQKKTEPKGINFKMPPLESTQRIDTLVVNNLNFEQQQECNRKNIKFVKVIEKSAYDALKRERDAYAKAKAENDERFQLEIGALRAGFGRMNQGWSDEREDHEETKDKLSRLTAAYKVLEEAKTLADDNNQLRAQLAAADERAAEQYAAGMSYGQAMWRKHSDLERSINKLYLEALEFYANRGVGGYKARGAIARADEIRRSK